jgi:Domain of unknown function (DUF4365)
MLTQGHRQEALSRAYARAIAAVAGLSVSEPENDYGIDMSLRAITIRGHRRRDLGPQLDLQLRCTTRASVGDTHVAYDLDIVSYNDLRDETDPAGRILFLLVLPDDESLWLSQSPQELVLRSCAYWISLRGYPGVAARKSLRIFVPLANVFSVTAVQGIMQRLRERKDP